jgi:hypothetical protein
MSRKRRDKIGWACNTQEKEYKLVKRLKPERERKFGRPRF